MNIAPTPYLPKPKREDRITAIRNFQGNVTLTLNFNPQTGSKKLPCYRAMNPEDKYIIAPSSRTTARSSSTRGSIPITIYTMIKLFDDFDGLLNRELYGSHAHRRHPSKRCQSVNVAENLDLNCHIHGKWRVPADRLDEFFEKYEMVWKRVWSVGTAKAEPYRQENWEPYLTKQIGKSENTGGPDRFILSRHPTQV